MMLYGPGRTARPGDRKGARRRRRRGGPKAVRPRPGAAREAANTAAACFYIDTKTVFFASYNAHSGEKCIKRIFYGAIRHTITENPAVKATIFTLKSLL